VSTRALHWPEYLIEAGALGTFMISACAFGTLLGHPASPVHRALGGAPAVAQRALMGTLMGLTAIALIYSPFGKRSGAHMNPAVTLTFMRLGKVAPHDAAFYAAAQFVGAVAGVFVARGLLGAMRLGDPAVNYVATEPGPLGATVAFAAEVLITFVQLSVVLRTASSPRWSRYTGLLAGLLVATYITLESPLSGMSMNPARSLGSAYFAGRWTWLWIYFVAPPIGMLLAAQLFLRRDARPAATCGAKLAHGEPCIFCEHLARQRQ
jgi:aquaporin Z